MNNSEELLSGLIREKEWLQGELHHRVRNILQVILSLLNSQLFYLEDEKAVRLAKDIQRRVFALALVHGQISQEEDSGRFPMQRYIPFLLGHLQESFGLGRAIRLENEVEDMALRINEAAAVGIIINEVVSDAIQYAFPGNGEGSIRVSLRSIGHDVVQLMVSNDGKGQSSLFCATGEACFSRELIKGLVRDLNAKFFTRNDNGPVLIIEFKKLI